MRLLPRSLFGQVMLALGAALLVAQAISAVLLWQAAETRREMALLHAAAFRLVADPDRPRLRERLRPGSHHGRMQREMHMRFPRAFGVVEEAGSPLPQPGLRKTGLERQLAEILSDQGVAFDTVAVGFRQIADDPIARARAQRRGWESRFGDLTRHQVMVAAIRFEPAGNWRSVRVLAPPREPRAFGTLLAQTVLILLALFAIMGLMLRRITRPLAALTRRTERFAARGNPVEPLAPAGPDDVRRLIIAHNAMEARIGSMLDEKDVMLGAIGHDLKTPLAALRVRIESVADESDRAKMADTIEDITRTLDDILSLARIGRANEVPDRLDLTALAASVVEDYEDMGEKATMADSPRIVAEVRETWLKRALRNLVGNALRYGGTARVSVFEKDGLAVLRVEDEGPGIPEERIASMLEPFQRGEASRNRATGGAGLGLTLARAIAEQHGGELRIANRAAGGLRADLALPH